MSKLPCMVMNYKLCISSHPGIIFWQWGCSWHAILLSRVLYHLNKNFETANMVNTQCRHSMAGAHESLFCQSSAGVLTGQLSTVRIQWCVVRVCVPAISCFISIHPFLSLLLFNVFLKKVLIRGTSITFTPAQNTSGAVVALHVVDSVSFSPALKYLEARFVARISGIFLWPRSSYLVF